METLFWSSFAVVVYVYAVYPLLLAAWARVAGRPAGSAGTATPRRWPSLSIVVAAHNEAPRLRARVGNLLALSYPARVEVIVVSDGSSDDPAGALAGFDDRVRLIDLPRGGKPQALNTGVALSTGDILVFADARQRFAPDALLHLVANFDDESVGAVTGELVLDSEQRRADSAVGEGVGLYWRYEKWLRRHESLVSSTLGATGAIYALRRTLWRPLHPDTLLDDVLAPMRVVLEGRRVVFEERALAFDQASSSGAAEWRRKTRTLAGNYQILALEPRLLLPFVNPVWWQYCSHKIGRLLVPWALLAAFGTSAVLAGRGFVYATAFVLQLGFYALAAFGSWGVIDRFARVAYTFVMMNCAAVAGLLALRRGRAVWR